MLRDMPYVEASSWHVMHHTVHDQTWNRHMIHNMLDHDPGLTRRGDRHWDIPVVGDRLVAGLVNVVRWLLLTDKHRHTFVLAFVRKRERATSSKGLGPRVRSLAFKGFPGQGAKQTAQSLFTWTAVPAS